MIGDFLVYAFGLLAQKARDKARDEGIAKGAGLVPEERISHLNYQLACATTHRDAYLKALQELSGIADSVVTSHHVDAIRKRMKTAEKERDEARAELEAIKARAKSATQAAVECLGSVGPESVDAAMGRMVAEVDRLKNDPCLSGCLPTCRLSTHRAEPYGCLPTSAMVVRRHAPASLRSARTSRSSSAPRASPRWNGRSVCGRARRCPIRRRLGPVAIASPCAQPASRHRANGAVATA